MEPRKEESEVIEVSAVSEGAVPPADDVPSIPLPGTVAVAEAVVEEEPAPKAIERSHLMDDFEEGDDDGDDDGDEQPAPWFPWRNLTFKTRVTLAFSFIAAMTALVAIAVVSVVWEQYFRAYTQDNMRAIAETTAEQIAEFYGDRDTFDSRSLQPASSAVSLSRGVGMQVLDGDGGVVYDSTTANSNVDKFVAPSIAPPQSSENMAESPILVDGREVGTVRVWVYGSNQLLREGDQEFRDKSYQAMAMAAVVAILLASIFGYFYARRVVRPIKRVTDAALAVKEGDLTVRTNMQGEDEISQLGRTFDSMVGSVERDRKLERRLTTDVAHELRTPLMAIQSTVEAMVDGVLPVDEERLMTVDSEVMRLSRLVDSLLKLSRLENRSNPNKQIKVDVGEVVSDIIATHEAYVNESGLMLAYRADPGVYVLGDPDLIRQATANLISNAVRYTDEGGGIYVRVRKGKTMASISVRDTGIGLSPEEAQMVFDRFWRADSGRDREVGGLGVGLTVVKEIVERHNGWVQVEGRKGEGACFTIHIPLYIEKDQRKDQRRDHRPRASRRRPV